MWRVVVAIIAVSVAVVGCGPRNGTPCGNSACNENEICDQALKLCVANLAPKIVIDAPAANAIIGSATFELRGTATDDQGTPAVIEYAIGDGAWAPLTADERGLFSVSVATPGGDGVAASIKVRATDASNNTSEEAVAVRFDRASPRCAIVSPASGKTVQTNTTLVGTVEASLEDGSAVTAELSTDDGATWQPMTVANSRGTYAWTLPAQIAREPRTLRLRTTDEAGNVCAFGPHGVFVDTAPPTLTLAKPDEGYQLGGDREGIVEATVGDGSGTLPRLFWSLDGQPATEFTEPVTASFVGKFPLPDVDYSAHVLEITARDEAGNQAVGTRNLFIDHVGPVITFVSPEANQVFNAADMADAGMKVRVSWTVRDANPTVRVFASVARGDAGPFQSEVFDASSVEATVSAADDGHEYVAQILASNPGGAGTETLYERKFRVDVIHPTFTVYPQHGARLTERAVRMTFKEPTTFANSAQALTWDAGGPALGQFLVTSDGGYAWLNLTPGTVYRGTLAPKGEDRAGNQIQQVTTWAFFTDPIAPVSGTVLIADAGTFSAAFDQDGVVTFADSQKDSAGNIRVRWFDIHPVTGAVIEKQSQLLSATTGSTHRTEVAAWASIAADGSTDRKTSLITQIDASLTGYLRTSSGYFTQHTSPNSYLLPNAVTPEQPRTGPVDYGLINTSGADLLYSRPPNADVTLPYPGSIVVGGEGSFMVWRARLVGTMPPLAEILERRVYVCSTGTFGPSCDFTAGGVVSGGVGTPSVAMTPTGRAIFVSTTAGQRTEHCQVEFRLDSSPCPVNECTSHTRQWPAQEDLTVRSSNDGDKVMGVQLSSGAWEVLERNTLPCETPWTVVVGLSTSAGSRPIPIRFGTTRAALYRDNNGNVTVLR